MPNPNPITLNLWKHKQDQALPLWPVPNCADSYRIAWWGWWCQSRYHRYLQLFFFPIYHKHRDSLLCMLWPVGGTNRKGHCICIPRVRMKTYCLFNILSEPIFTTNFISLQHKQDISVSPPLRQPLKKRQYILKHWAESIWAEQSLW